MLDEVQLGIEFLETPFEVPLRDLVDSAMCLPVERSQAMIRLSRRDSYLKRCSPNHGWISAACLGARLGRGEKCKQERAAESIVKSDGYD